MTFTLVSARRSGVCATAIALLLPAAAHACACGCGVFDVGDNAVVPMASDNGVTLFYRFSAMSQNDNREHGHAADPADNSDKRIATDFHTVGAEVRLSPKWSVMAELPIYDRRFTTTASNAQGNDIVETVPMTALGDAIVRVTYSGLAADLSTGVTLGVKLPTGRTTSPTDAYGNQPYDRDTLPGTGSTDVIVGAYHVGHFAGARLSWFAQGQYQVAVATRDGYRPGNEADGAIGLSYALPVRGSVGVSPVLQVLGSVRGRDSGVNADPFNSGYQRLLIAPGLRVQVTRQLSLYGDVEVPIAQYVNAASAADLASGLADSSGQLVAPVQFRFQVSYGF